MSVALSKRGSSALTHLLTADIFFCEFSKTFKITYFIKYIYNTASVNVIFLKADLKIALFSQKFTILSRKLKLFVISCLYLSFHHVSFFIFSRIKIGSMPFLVCALSFFMLTLCLIILLCNFLRCH